MESIERLWWFSWSADELGRTVYLAQFIWCTIPTAMNNTRFDFRGCCYISNWPWHQRFFIFLLSTREYLCLWHIFIFVHGQISFNRRCYCLLLSATQHIVVNTIFTFIYSRVYIVVAHYRILKEPQLTYIHWLLTIGYQICPMTK
jgi:hypothetical protein